MGKKLGTTELGRCSGANVNIEDSQADVEIFPGTGVFYGLTIWQDVDGGTFTVKDADGNAIYPSGITDYVGGFSIAGGNGQILENGCYITTENFNGGKITAFYTRG